MTLDASVPSLSAQSSLESYGGDAFTGIQHAAAHTEAAVVDGTNQLAAFQKALLESYATRQAVAQSRADHRLHQGLAAIVLSLGVLTFIVALTRRLE